MAAAFTLTDVSLHYSEKQLLSHISITISEGDKIGVVGRNGAGKSTLLRLLAGTEEADAGDIARKRGLTLAYLPQTPHLRPEDSITQAALSFLPAANEAERESAAYEAQTILSRLGFTDFDHEGLLIEGYEYLAPMASLYNYPYYERHMDAYGLVKEADWIEFQVFPPKEVPERLQRIADIVKARTHVRVDKVQSTKELTRKYGIEYMDVIDAAYQKLYNFQPMTKKQKEYYRDMYFPAINFDFVTLVVNEKDEIVGVGVGMPDISKALRKCGGHLFPTGWYHVLKALKTKHIEVFDLLLIAVRPDYQDKGINALFFVDQIPYMNKYGVKYAETTSILETNWKNQANWTQFEHKQHKRRRAYIKDI